MKKDMEKNREFLIQYILTRNAIYSDPKIEDKKKSHEVLRRNPYFMIDDVLKAILE